MELTHEQFIAYVNGLPPELKHAYFSDEIDEEILSIGKRNALLLNDIGVLAHEVGRVIIGLTPASAFISRVQQSLHIESQAARTIGQEINERIFSKIRESLRAFRKERGEEEDVAASAAFAPAGAKAAEIGHPEREEVLRGIEAPESLPMRVHQYYTRPAPAAPAATTAVSSQEPPAEKPLPAAAERPLPAVRDIRGGGLPERTVMPATAPTNAKTPLAPISTPAMPPSKSFDPYREPVE